MRNRMGKSKAVPVIGVVFLLGILFVAGMFWSGKWDTPTTAAIGDLGVKEKTSFAGCPTDGDTLYKIDAKNVANASGSEAFDNSGYLYKVVNGDTEYVGAITDTTAPTAAAIDCGYEYIYAPISSSGASGDSSVVTSVLSGGAWIVDGNLHFNADSSNKNLIIGIEQHASLNCRLFDNNQNAFVYDSGDSSNTNYETDGVTWTSTTDNATAMDETIGMSLVLDCKSVETDTNYNDRGILFLSEAPTAVWATPTLKVNGQTLSDMKANLNPNEAKAYSGYEYVYLYDGDVYDAGDGMTVEYDIALLAGVSTASVDPELDMTPRGGKLSIDGVNVITGGVDDTSSTAQIHTLFDNTFDVT